MTEESFFITIGRLTFNLLEAIDLIYEKEKNKTSVRNWLKRSVKEQLLAFARIELIVDELKEPEIQLETNTFPYATNEKVVFNEEFLLENVKSSSKIKILLYSMNVQKTKHELNCLGYTIIPISRLEENRTIIQYYQLLDPNTSEGIRTALKAKFVFNTDAPINKATSRKDSIAGFVKGIDGQTLFTQMDSNDGNNYLESQLSEELAADGTNPNDNVTGAVNENIDGRLPRRYLLHPPHEEQIKTEEKDEIEKESPDESAKEKKDEHDGYLDLGIIDYAIILGPTSPVITRPTHLLKDGCFERILENGRRKPLDPMSPGGVITSSSNAPAGTATSGLFSSQHSFTEIINNEIKIWDRLPSEDLPDMELPSKIEWFACPEGSITIASKERPKHYIRSFVLNAGGDTGEIYGICLNVFVRVYDPPVQNEKPDPFIQSQDTESSLQFSNDENHNLATPFKGIQPPDFSECSPPENSDRRDTSNPSIQAKQSIPFSKESSSILQLNVSFDDTTTVVAADSLPLWTLTTICFLFRIPYFEQLSSCLEFAYRTTIEPEIERWEQLKQHEIKSFFKRQEAEMMNSSVYRQQQEKDQENDDGSVVYQVGSQYSLFSLPNDLSRPQKENNIHNNYRKLYFSSTIAFPSCSLLMDRLISFLFSECPKPIPNLLSVQVDLTSSSLPFLQSEEQVMRDLGDTQFITSKRTVHFIAQNPEFLPNPSNRITFLLQCFGPRVLLDILTCVLSESRMIFYSRDLNKVTSICEGFRILIYPLIWTHVYLPIVPLQLLNLVEAPVPFLLGTHSDNLYHMNLYNINDIILIDCDNGIIMENNNSVVATENMSSPVKFPAKEDRWLMFALKEIQKTLPGLYSNAQSVSHSSSSLTNGLPPSSPSPWKEVQSTDQMIQLLIYDVMIRLLRYIPDCLFYLSTTCPIFNRPLFIMEYTSSEYKLTLENLSITNAFHVLTENVYSNGKKFILFCLRKLDDEEDIEDLSLIEDDSVVVVGSGSSAADDILGGQQKGRRGSGIQSQGGEPPGSPKTGQSAAMVANENNAASMDYHSPEQAKPAGLLAKDIFNASTSPLDLNDEPPHPNTAISAIPLPPNARRNSERLPPQPIEPQHEKGIDLKASSVDSMISVSTNTTEASHPQQQSSAVTAASADFEKPELTRSLSRGYKFSQSSTLIRKISSNMILLDSPSSSNPNNANGAGGTFFSPTGQAPGGIFSPSGVGRSGSGPLTFKTAKSFIRMESSPIFRKQLNTEPTTGTPFFDSPFAGVLPEWILETDIPCSVGNKDNSSDYIVYLIEDRMKYYKNLTKEYLDCDLNQLYSTNTSNRLQSPASSASSNSSAGKGSTSSFPQSFPHNVGQVGKVVYQLNLSSNITTAEELPDYAARIDLSSILREGPTSNNNTNNNDLATTLPTVESKVETAEEESHPEINDNPPENEGKDEENDEKEKQESEQKVPNVFKNPDESKALELEDPPEDEQPNIQADIVDAVSSPEASHPEPEQIENNSPIPIPPALSLLNTEKELILFDRDLIEKAQNSVHFWNLTTLAEHCHISVEELMKVLKKSPYSLLYEGDEEYQHFNSHSSSFRQSGSIGYRQASSFTTKPIEGSQQQQASTDPANNPDTIINDFLTLLLTVKDIDGEMVSQSMNRCELSLEKQINRSHFIQLLKNAKKDHHNRRNSHKNNKNSAQNQVDQNVYPLHSTAFDCISQLFLKILTICNEQQDYINAFRLLEIGGHYFHLISLSNKRGRNDLQDASQHGSKHLFQNKQHPPNDAEEDNDKSKDYELQTLEFLSERICHHPIYHLSSMWKGLLLDRLPLQSNPSTTTTAAVAAGEENTTNPPATPKPANKKYHINVIMAEIRSLLYMMLDLGVNSARALYFIQSITTDYQLTINEYLNLQRFTTNLWSQHQQQQLQFPQQSSDFMTNLEYDLLESQNSHLFHPANASATIPAANGLQVQTGSLPVPSTGGGSNPLEGGIGPVSLQTVSSGSATGTHRGKKSRGERRASTAGISELMMKHGNASASAGHLTSKTLSRSNTLYSESSDYNFQQYKKSKSQELHPTTSLNASSLPINPTSSTQLSFSLSASQDPIQARLGGAGRRYPHDRHHSLPNPHRVDSFFTIPSEDSHEESSSTQGRSKDNHGLPGLVPSASQETPLKPTNYQYPQIAITPMSPTHSERSEDSMSSPNHSHHVPNAISPSSPQHKKIMNSNNSPHDEEQELLNNSSIPFQKTISNHSQSMESEQNAPSIAGENISVISGSSRKTSQTPTPGGDSEHNYHFSSYDLLQQQQQQQGLRGSFANASNDSHGSGSHHGPSHHLHRSKKLCDLSLGFYPQEIKGLESINNVNQMTSIGNWLILGSDENLIEVVDLRSFSVAGKLKQGSQPIPSSSSASSASSTAGKGPSTASSYHGITALNVLEDPFYYENYDNHYNHDFVMFSGCSGGMIKVWNLPDLSYHYHPTDRNDVLFDEEEERLQLQHYLEEERELEKRLKSQAQALVAIDGGEEGEGNQQIVDGSRESGVEEAYNEEEGKKPSTPAASTFSSFFSSTSAKRNTKTGLFWGISGSSTANSNNNSSTPPVMANHLMERPNHHHQPPSHPLPPPIAGNNSKLKVKTTSVLTMKTHSAMITSLLSQPHPDHLNGWILASGDCRGDLTILKSNDGASIASTIGINIKTSPSPSSSTTSATTAVTRNSKIHHIYPADCSNAINDYTISAMSFFQVSSSAYGPPTHLPSYLIVGNYLGILNIIDIDYGISVYQSQGHLLKINKILPLKSGHQQFLTCSNDRNIMLWDIRMRQPVNQTNPSSSTATVFDPTHPFNVEERCLGYAMNSMGGNFDQHPLNPLSSVNSTAYSGSVYSVNSSSGHHHRHHGHGHHGQSSNTAAISSTLSYQQFQYYQQISYKKSSSGPITDMAVGGLDQSLVISTSADGIIKLWDLRYNLMMPYQTIMNGHYPNRITSVIWEKKKIFSRRQQQQQQQQQAGGGGSSSVYEDFFYTASYDGTVRSWDVITGANHSTFSVAQNKIQQPISQNPVGNSFLMMSSMMKNTTNNLLQSLHGGPSPFLKNVNEEKLVQMMKPAFFYEHLKSSTANKNASTVNNSTMPLMGEILPNDDGDKQDSPVLKCYRNCLVTRNCYGAVQLFVNNAINPSTTVRTPRGSMGGSSQHNSSHGVEPSTHSSFQFFSNADHIFV